MDLTFTDQETAFRDELREWLAANPPGHEPTRDEASYAWRRDWQRKLHEGGWAGVHWPVEYGGRGAALMGAAVFFEELGRARAPLPPNALGLLMGGPTLMAWGPDEEQGRHPQADLFAGGGWGP